MNHDLPETFSKKRNKNLNSIYREKMLYWKTGFNKP